MILQCKVVERYAFDMGKRSTSHHLHFLLFLSLCSLSSTLKQNIQFARNKQITAKAICFCLGFTLGLETKTKVCSRSRCVQTHLKL